MSDSPLLSKMDALLKKHRGTVEDTGDASSREAVSPPVETTDSAETAAPPNAWLPVLTQVIERGTPPAPPQQQVAREEAPPAQASDSVEASAAEAPPVEVVSDTLAEQLMSELAPRLTEVMEKQVAAELRKNLDRTVSTLLSQLDVNVREIVRDAVAEKLKTPHDPSK